MATAQKFNIYTENLAEKVHDHLGDSHKVSLHLTAPVATNSIFTDLTDIAGGNGYTAAGDVVAVSESAQDPAGTYKLTLTDNVWTASGGAIADFRYPCLYNDTPTGPVDPLILFWDYGSTVILADGETFTWDQDVAGAGVFTIV